VPEFLGQGGGINRSGRLVLGKDIERGPEREVVPSVPLTEQPSETHGSPQFPGPALTGDFESTAERRLGGDFVMHLRKVEFTSKTVQLGLLKSFVVLHQRERLVENPVRVIEATE
jgi:hypothetical protein